MNIESIININRVVFLIRNEIFSNYTKIFTVFGAIAAVLFVNMLFSRNIGAGLFEAILFIGGVIYTSGIFKELHNPQKGISYLMQPASIPEKFLAKLLLSTIGYSLAVIVFLFLFSVVISGLSSVIFGKGSPLFNPFTLNVIWMILNYFIIQSVFLLGSVYFKRSALFKTILALFVFVILLGLMSFISIRIVYGNDLSLNLQELSGSFKNYFISYIPGIAKTLYLFAAAPLFWIVGYFRLKETEV